MQATKHASKVIQPALKARSPKHWFQSPQKKDQCPPKLFLFKKMCFLRLLDLNGPKQSSDYVIKDFEMVVYDFYRPQRSWGMVIFLEAYVKNSVHKEGGV